MTMMIDLCADIGGGFGRYRIGDDGKLSEFLSSGNIACGFHAGDPLVMDRTVRLCVDRGLSIGALPGFPDIRGFGRRAMELKPEEICTDLHYQLGALNAFAAIHGTRISHVSPAGKLGNLVVTNKYFGEAVANAVFAYSPELIVLTQEGALATAARERGIPVGIMGFADRAYNDDGSLVSRDNESALIIDPDTVVERAVDMATNSFIRTINGRELYISCDSILLHGDTVNAVDLARLVRQEMNRVGVRVAPLAAVINSRQKNAGK